MKRILTILLLVFSILICACDGTEPPITLKTITEISFDEKEATINVGDEYFLPISYSGTGNINDIEFDTDIDNLVTFDDDIVIAIKSGYVIITAIAKDNPEIKDSMKLTIKDSSKRLETVRFDFRTSALRVGDSMPVVIANLNNLGVTSVSDFIYTVSDSSVLEIDENYNVIALKEGIAEITATQKDYILNTGVFTVYVGYETKDKTTSGEPKDKKLILYVEDDDYVIDAGIDKQLMILDAQNYQRYFYSSSDGEVLCVSDTGMLMGIKEGVVTVRASSKDGGGTNIIKIKVTGQSQVNYIERLLNIALAEQGYTEWTGNNDTKYGEWNMCNYEAWCAIFVSWCANNAGIPNTILLRSISVTVYMDRYQQMGLFYYKEEYQPVPGDLIIFKNNGASHVGIVVASDSTKVYTIEGNTSNMVARRSYNLNYGDITGYCHPNYGDYSFDTQIEWK